MFGLWGQLTNFSAWRWLNGCERGRSATTKKTARQGLSWKRTGRHEALHTRWFDEKSAILTPGSPVPQAFPASQKRQLTKNLSSCADIVILENEAQSGIAAPERLDVVQQGLLVAARANAVGVPVPGDLVTSHART